jgi:hypothetical protein
VILFARHVDVRAMFALTTILYVCNRIVAIADGVRVMVIRKPLRYVNTTARFPLFSKRWLSNRKKLGMDQVFVV